ncbi:MAG: ferredoxin:protochlorophyllide reductase (ATP-dependent) subunit N, partial [Phycisphaerales bacterium]
GVDTCLKALVPELPTVATNEPALLVCGTLADVVEDQFARLFAELGIGRVDFFPPRRAAARSGPARPRPDAAPPGQAARGAAASPTPCSG